MSRRRIRTAGLGVVAAIVAGGLAGAVIAAQRDPQDPQEFATAIRNTQSVKIADIPSAGALRERGLFVQKTSSGLFCLWDAASASSPDQKGGCNSAENPLGGKPLFVSFSYEGGPAISDVVDARLVGLATADVATVLVLMRNGRRQTMPLRRVPSSVGDFRAFVLRFGPGELRRGMTPTAVVALDASGTELDRQATGF